jgi:hypothetical protein
LSTILWLLAKISRTSFENMILSPDSVWKTQQSEKSM